MQTASPCEVSQDSSTQTSDQPVSLISLDVAVQTSSHGIHTSSLDAAVQTIPPVPCLSTFLHRWVLAQLPRFLLMCLFRLPYAVRCYTMLPHNYRSRSSLLAVFSQTILWTAETLFVSTRYQYRVHVPCCSHRQDSNSLHRLQASLLMLTCALHPHGIPVTAAPLRSRLHSAISVTHPQPPACTIHVGTHHARSATVGKRSASTALAGTHNPVNTDSRAGNGLFPKTRAIVLLVVHFGQSKSDGHSGLDTADSDLMHHQFRLSLLQWNPDLARRNPTNIVSAACGKFHAVILQEASDHVPHIYDQFMAYTGNTDLAILLNKDTFEPDPIVLTFKADSTSKGAWGMVLLIVRGLLRRPSLSGSPTVTFCLSTHSQCRG